MPGRPVVVLVPALALIEEKPHEAPLESEEDAEVLVSRLLFAGPRPVTRKANNDRLCA
jgi:hypothetical protein